MAPSSSTLSTVTMHGRFPYLTPSIIHSSPSGILPSDTIFYSGLPEQPSGGSFSGLSPEATNYADLLGDGGPNNIGICNVESQQIPGFVRTVDESGGRDEWGLEAIITTDITPNRHQLAESEPQQLYPTVSHCPKRAKARMRWTMELHDRFLDAVKLLGGSERAKPKAILEIMNVEGLTREQVKSHLQKYKAQVKHHPAEVCITVPGTSVETNEVIPSAVQRHIQEYALQVQVEFQKKLHDMVERTLREIHRSLLENHVHPLPSPAAAAWSAAALSARGSRGVRGEPSNTAAPDDEGGLVNQATEAGNEAGA